MTISDIKNFIYMPDLGLIEAGENTDDAVERITIAQVKKEIADKKMLRQLKTEYPGREIIQCGSSWIIMAEK